MSDFWKSLRVDQSREQWEQFGTFEAEAETPTAGNQKPPRSALDYARDMGAAIWEGAKSTGRMVGASGNTFTGDLRDVEDYALRQQLAQESRPEAVKALTAEIERRKQANPEGGVVDAIRDVGGAMIDNPEGSAQFVIEQAPNSAVALGVGWAGAKLGAAGGSVFGPVGAAVGGVGGFLGGMFLGNTLLETGGKAIEKAEGGFTEAERGEAIREGVVKGGVITAVDAATLGAGNLVSKSLGRAAINAGARAEARVLADAGVDLTSRAAIEAALTKNPALRQAAKTAGEAAAKAASTAGSKAGMAGTGLVMETAGEGTGEYLGELAATGKADVYDAVMEAAAGFTQSAPEVAWNMRQASSNDLNAKNIQRQGADLQGTPPGAPPAPPPATSGAAATPNAPTAADPSARLAELEILAEQRDLTPAERQEAVDLLTALSQQDEQDAPQGTEPEAAEAAPVEAAAPEGSDGAPADGVPDARAAEPVEAAGVGSEFADLFDEQGRPKFSSAQSVKNFKERTGLGQDGVRAIQTAVQEGRPITLDEARQADLAGQERRGAALEQSKAESEAEAERAKENARKPAEERKILGEYEIPGIDGSTSRVRVFQQGGQIEAVGLDEGTANNDLSRLVQSGLSVEQALATLYGDHGPNEAPDPGRVKRAGQSAPTNFWTFAASRGFKPGQLRVGTPEHAVLKAEFDALKSGASTAPAGALEAGAMERSEPDAATSAPSAIQNRDRSRAASVAQMRAIASNPDYMRLGPSRTPDSGAPMVFAVNDETTTIPAGVFGREDVAVMADGQRIPFRYAVVEADQVQPSNFVDGRANPMFASAAPGTLKALNNGRTAGVRAAYDQGTAVGYRQELIADSASHGVPVEAIQSMSRPMLVRVYSEANNTGDIGARSQGQGLGMSPVEQARQDAGLIDSALLSAYRPGDIGSADNRDFVRGFVGKLRQAGQDVAGMMTGTGELSQLGRNRLRAALLQAAYGDSELVQEMFDSTDTDIKGIGEALIQVSGRWADMRDSARLGVINPAVDITENLMQAVRLVQKARRERTAVIDLLNQIDIETGEAVSDLTADTVRLFYTGRYLTRAVAKDKLAQSLSEYTVAAQATSAEPDMMGDMVGPREILRSLLSGQQNQEGLFDGTVQEAADGGREPAGGGDPVAGAEESSRAGQRQRGARGGRQAGSGGGAKPADGRPEAGAAAGQGEAGDRAAADAGREEGALNEGAPGRGGSEAPEPAAPAQRAASTAAPAEPAPLQAGRIIQIEVPAQTVAWMGFSGRKAVRADLNSLAARHSEYYDDAAGVRTDIEFVLGRPDGWYVHKDRRVVLFRERVGSGSIPQARIEIEADADTMTVRSVYVGGKRQIAKKMADKRALLGDLGLGGQSPDSLTIAEYLLALGSGSSRPATPSDVAPEAVGDLTPLPAASQSLATARAPAPAEQKAQKRIGDVGEQLYANRRNFVGRGLKWEDVASLNDTLKVKEVKKAKVWPKPDYDQLIAEGMPAVLARMVKHVYDGLGAGPTVRGTPTDADLERYIDTIAKVRAAIFGFTQDKDAVTRFADAVQAMIGRERQAGPISLMAGMQDAKALADTLLARIWPEEMAKPTSGRFRRGSDASAEALVIGGNRALRALQFDRDDLAKWSKDIGEGWPAKREAWQVQGYRVLAPGEYTVGDEQQGTRYNRQTGEREETGETYFGISAKGLRRTWMMPARPAEGSHLLVDENGSYVRAFEGEQAAIAAARDLVKRDQSVGQDNRGTNISESERTGPARRQEGEDISADRLKETFGFRGVNFGREGWIKQAERQAYLNAAYDGLLDMAEILGVPPQAMSLDGMLGIAFGAQGSGAFAAHFIPGHNEINLTRTRGAGTLAHEWGHALDHWFATQAGLAKDAEPMVSEHADKPETRTRMEAGPDGKMRTVEVPTFGDGIRPEIVQAFRAIVQAMSKRPETEGEARMRQAQSLAQSRKNAERWLANAREVIARSTAADKDALLAEFDRTAEAIRSGDPGEGYVQSGNLALSPRVAELRELTRKATGRLLGKDAIEGLQMAARWLRSDLAREEASESHEPQRFVSTEYASESAQLDAAKSKTGKKRYWSTPTEMFARAFETYVHERLAAKGQVNTFLTDAERRSREMVDVPDNSSANARGGGQTRQIPAYPYPRGVERAAINRAFDTLIEAIETRETDTGVAMFSRRGWSKDFPDAVLGHRQGVAQAHPDYEAAKAGDDRAALRLARDLVSNEYVEAVRAAIPAGARPTIVPVLAVEASGNNRIPLMVAKVLGEKLGLKVETGVFQSRKVGRGGSDGFHRLANPPSFTGEVGPGGYLILDDTLTQGGTLAQLKTHIEDSGGRVLLASALTGKGYSATIALSNERLAQLRDRYGSIEPWWRDTFGHGFDGLTESEARFILSLRDRPGPDALRDRVTEARVRGLGGLGGRDDSNGRDRPPVASRGGTPSGLPVANVTRIAAAIARTWANRPEVVVVAGMQDPLVPQAVRDYDAEQRSQGATGEPEGFFYDGKVYLLAGQLATPADVVRVLAHESLGHYGLRGLFGDRLAGILDQIVVARPKEVAAKRKEYGLPDTVAGRRRAAEEVLAVMAQTNPQLGFVRRAVAAIRSWLRSQGLKLRMTDAEIINSFILPARGWVERGERAMRPGGKVAFTRSAMKSVTANIDRGLKALTDAITGKTTVHRAMFRNGLGWVDFVWGDEGTVKPNGRTKGGKGLSHIVEARMRKDGLTEREAINVLSEMVRAIASGAEIKRIEAGGSISVKIEHDGYRVALVKSPGANAWVITAFEIGPDARPAGWATAAPTQSAASLSRDGMGAGPVAPGDTNPSLDRATRGDSTARGGTAGAGSTAIMTPDVGDGNAMFSRSTLGDTPPPDQPPANRWQALKVRVMNLTSPETLDKLIYELQDKFIDLKRLREHLAEIGGTITDLNDAYLGEELYHKRLAKRTQDFIEQELRPLLHQLKIADIPTAEFERFLHARHAPEANRVLAERNPNQAQIDQQRDTAAAAVRELELQLQRAQAAGTAVRPIEQALEQARAELARWNRAQAFQGTEQERLSLSGMSDDEAAAIMAAVPPGKRKQLDAVAARVDAINAKTLDTLQRYGLMDKASLDAWRSTYQHYVPLHRDEAHPDSASHPIGQGYSVKGDAGKRRTGSNEKVTHILGHIAMQREAALTRGEKNLVAKKLYLLAAQNPDANLWTVDRPPKIKRIDEATGTVMTMVDPLYKSRPNVVMVRIGGKDAAVVFNERNPRALRLAEALKNLDVGDLHAALGVIAKGTRWFASVNTQYNPIFGLINLARDAQAGLLQLSTTPIAGAERDVAANMPSAMRAIYRERRGKAPGDTAWARLWQQMQDDGGTTGYRDLFADAKDRSAALERELKALGRGKASQSMHAVLDWLSAYNETMENTVRLAAYKVALDRGMSRERAASLAKNLTVNFNRKGRQAREIGAMYAFFNAAVQGTTRMAETLRGPAGKRIMLGGVMLGAMSTLLGMTVMGGGDDDQWEKIPDFVKERSVIIPLGREDYVSIPMPLGFHVLPNIGRIAIEMMLGAPDATRGEHLGNLLMIIADAFNPLGGSQNFWQMASPTVTDPVIALMQNEDWTGKPIYRPDYNKLDPTPGHQRSKDSASTPSRLIAWGVNWASGGSDFRPGLISWTPDQIDYVIGQLTGGVGRELIKLNQTITAPFTGDELPAYKIPLAGRIYGNTRGPSAQSERFYENLRDLNMLENELKGRVRSGEPVEQFLEEEPLAALIQAGKGAERQLRSLREMRSNVIRAGLSGHQQQVREINERIGAVMGDLNRGVRAAKIRVAETN